jgi:hypothetical protein
MTSRERPGFAHPIAIVAIIVAAIIILWLFGIL